jgi:hypothetical protein
VEKSGKADRIIMGHSIQDNGRRWYQMSQNGIPRIFLIDVMGMSSAYGTGKAALILHMQDKLSRREHSTRIA